MFIKDVINIIWGDLSRTYKDYLLEYKEWTVQKLLDKLKGQLMDYYQFDNSFFNRLVTKGCSRHYSTSLSGCSMCNLHGDMKVNAMMQILYEKDINQYSHVVLSSFKGKRNLVSERHWREYVFSNDFLSDNEITDECLEGLFGKQGVYQKKSLHIEFETHVESIKSSRLLKLKKYLPNTKIWVRVGVECEDEWIREHWLNKPISNKEIINAINLCHSHGIKIITNVLLGLPGFTEQCSIMQFHKALVWLFQNNVDRISCSFLDRKPYTLQHFIYENFQNSQILKENGIADGEHTGLPWLFTLTNVLERCYTFDPQIIKKIVFGQFEETYINGMHQMAYNYDKSCNCAKKIFSCIRTSPQLIIECLHSLYDDPCYPRYELLKEKQKKIINERENIQIVADEITKKYGELSAL